VMSIRLWPGIVAVVFMRVVRVVIPHVLLEASFFGFDVQLVGVMGSILGAVAIAVWWVVFSRAAWPDRLAAIILMIGVLAMTGRVAHESIAGAGMGMLLYVQAIPVLGVALVVWAAASRNLSPGFRRASLVVTVLLACGLFTVVRTSGVTSDVIGSEFHWRWTPTPEAQLLAQVDDEPEALLLPSTPAVVPSEPATTDETESVAAAGARSDDEIPVEWPGFRGPDRDGVVHGVHVNTNWSESPPLELWRRPIGPGWSSFAVSGDLFYTQEQRGDDEIVACYRVSTGEPVWRHRDTVRFWESNGGAGPRATPTLAHGRVYTFGATGVVNALDAATGEIVWSRNGATDTGRALPG
jgi:outer membrane protein assembly factor BamB